MSGDDHEVVLEDLLVDEAKWRAISDVMQEAHTTAQGVEVLPDFVTDGLSYAMGFQDQYQKLASQTVTFIGDGVIAMRDIADRLHETHNEYESSEYDAEQESAGAEWV